MFHQEVEDNEVFGLDSVIILFFEISPNVYFVKTFFSSSLTFGLNKLECWPQTGIIFVSKARV